MKVLLICIVLTIECYAEVEKLNVTTTATLEKPEFESSKSVNQIQSSTRSTVYKVTTELTPNRNDSSEKHAISKKKPFVRLRKQKIVSKSNKGNSYNSYKVHENGEESREPTKKLERNRSLLALSEAKYRTIKVPYEKSDSHNDFQRDESKVITSYRFPESSAEISKEHPHMEMTRKQNFYKRKEDNFENYERDQELSYDENDPKISTYFESQPQVFSNNFRNGIGEGPSLPEINKVIQKLNTDSYQSANKNHIVEVNKVPIVFEHHYQGDYESPRSKFVAHQYSYSPPADNSNEAYQLGKILSQNVVRKLQSSAEKPLQEFIEDNQEVTLNIPVHATSSISQQSYFTAPRERFSGSQFLHPLVKHLVPEISHNEFDQDIQNFQNTKTNAYQVIIPKTQMNPIVVEEEQIKPVYETTFLSAIYEPQIENNQYQTTSQQYRTNSPYSVNVQQEFMDVPKYTLMSFFNLQDRIKPEAIHEVAPPNLAKFNNFRNVHFMTNHAPAVFPEIQTEFLKNSEYLTKSPNEQYREENPISKWRSGLEVLKPQFVKYTKVDPTPVPKSTSYHPHPKTQMIQSRPYWRKPQIMKLIRMPEQYHQIEQEYQPHQQQDDNIREFEPHINIENNNEIGHNQQYSTANPQVTVSNENSPSNQDLSDPSNLIQLVRQYHPEQSDVQHQVFDSVPLDQETFNFDKQQPKDEPKSIYFTQEPYENRVVKENPHPYMNMKKNKNANELNHNKHQNIRTEVQIVKSVSPQYFQSPRYESSIQHTADYSRPTVEDEALSVELPKGYLNFQDPRSIWRAPTSKKSVNTRLKVPSENFKFREINENFRGKNVFPYSRLRRLVPSIPGPNIKQKNISYLVLMREEDDS